MYSTFPSADEVRSMADVRVRAEFLAWITHDAYRIAACHARDLSRSDRADALRKARQYRRRAIRASQHANSRA